MHISPLEVICARFVASHMLNQMFQALPEANDFQRIVHPSSCDAEVDLVRSHMVDTMVLLGEDDVHPL